MAIKLVDVEISEPLPRIRGLGDFHGVWVLLREHGTPLGCARMYGHREALEPDELARELVHQLGERLLLRDIYNRLVGDRPREVQDFPRISVLVCTRDRPESLALTLDSLVALDYPNYDVVVADNCPSDDRTRRLVEQYPAKYVMEPVPGHSWVRNRAILESDGDIVAFIDDDMVADPKWLKAVASCFADPRVGCVTSLVLPSEVGTWAQELFETVYGGFNCGFEKRVYTPGEETTNHWFGTHCAFRRDVIAKVGMFDVVLGLPVGGAEDVDLIHRTMRAGYSCVYTPDALRFHKHRDSMDALRKQLHGYSKSMYAFLLKNILREPENRRTLVKYALRYFYRMHMRRPVRRLMRRGEQAPMPLILTEAWGALLGPYAYLRSVINFKRMKARRYGI